MDAAVSSLAFRRASRTFWTATEPLFSSLLYAQQSERKNFAKDSFFFLLREIRRRIQCWSILQSLRDHGTGVMCVLMCWCIDNMDEY